MSSQHSGGRRGKVEKYPGAGVYKKAPAQERDPTFAPLPVFEFLFCLCIKPHPAVSACLLLGVLAGFVLFLHPKWRFRDPGRPRPCIWVHNDRKKISFHKEPAHVSKSGPHVTPGIIDELVLQRGDLLRADRCTAQTEPIRGSGRAPKRPNGT